MKPFLSFYFFKKAFKKYGLTLWKSGGYYYLSGLNPQGKHIQGIFSNLRNLQAQLKEIEGWKW